MDLECRGTSEDMYNHSRWNVFSFAVTRFPSLPIYCPKCPIVSGAKV